MKQSKGFVTSNTRFAGEVLASLLAALVVAALTYFISMLVVDPLLASFVAALMGCGATLAAMRLRLLNLTEIIGGRYLDRNTGISKVYPSLDEAASDLIYAAQIARRIDLLIHIGRREFGITDSLFYETLKSRLANQGEEDLEVRLLHIDLESPYLSEQRAQELGKRRDKWLRDVEYVRSQIIDCARGRKNLRIRTHKEPFLWRLFIFDDQIFLSAYLHSTKNDKHAPVYRIHQGPQGTNSLYSTFKRYYDHLWQLTT
jgi:hypothetical protein